MTPARLLTAAALAASLAAGPALIAAADAAPAKSRAAKAKAADPAATPPAEAAPAAPPAAPEQQIATSNPAAAIPAVLQASGQFTTLIKALDATNLTSVVGGPRAITVFAPTDAAFAALPPGALDALLKPDNAATLQKVLTYHVVATKVPASQVRGHAASPVPTAAGANVTVDGSAGAIKVGGATVLQSDVQASNGVIYVIDKVLLPPGVSLPAGEAAATSPSAPTGAPATPPGA